MAFSIGIVCYSIGVAVDMLLPAGVPLCAAPSEWKRRCLRAYVLEGRPACLRARVCSSPSEPLATSGAATLKPR
jgi:hypothetical protein